MELLEFKMAYLEQLEACQNMLEKILLIKKNLKNIVLLAMSQVKLGK